MTSRLSYVVDTTSNDEVGPTLTFANIFSDEPILLQVGSQFDVGHSDGRYFDTTDSNGLHADEDDVLQGISNTEEPNSVSLEDIIMEGMELDIDSMSLSQDDLQWAIMDKSPSCPCTMRLCIHNTQDAPSRHRTVSMEAHVTEETEEDNMDDQVIEQGLGNAYDADELVY